MKIIMTCFSQTGNTHKVNDANQFEADAQDEAQVNSEGGADDDLL